MKHLSFYIVFVVGFLFCQVQAEASTSKEEKRIEDQVNSCYTNKDEHQFNLAIEEQREYWLKKKNMTMYFETWYTQATYNINWGHYYQAMQIIRELAAEIKSRKQLQYNYIADNLLGILYLYRGNDDVAVTYFNKALNEMSDDAKKKGHANNIYIALSNTLIEKNPKKAEQYILKVKNNKDHPYVKSGILSYLTMIAYEQGDKKKFMRYYNEYINIKKKDSTQFCYANYSYVLYNYCMIHKQYDQALKYSSTLMDSILIYGVRTEIYRMMGDYKKALECQSIKDSLQKSQNNKILIDDVNDLSHAQDIAQMQTEKAHSRLLIIAAIVTLGIFIVSTSLLLIYSHRKQNRILRAYNKQLEEAHDRLSQAISIRHAYVKDVKEQIKSPLRILSDYARIFNNDQFNLSEKEKENAVINIESNVKTIESMMGSIINLYKHADKDGGLTTEQTNYTEQCQTALRSPLNTISGFAQIMGSDNYDMSEEDREEMMHTISNQAHIITQSINQILDLSHADSVTCIKKEDKITINSICHAALDNYDLHNHSLKKIFNSTIPNDVTIITHYEILTKVLNCLLNNADKFTTIGTISISCEELKDKASYVIRVSDTGIGIDKDAIPLLYNRFYKADQQTEGLGLGLPLCKRLTTLLGYTIDIDADYHPGARFNIIIPA